MLIIPGLLREVTMLSIPLRLLIAALCGGLIGVERGRKRHVAGLRTHAMVEPLREQGGRMTALLQQKAHAGPTNY